jgi:hypothetical protein
MMDKKVFVDGKVTMDEVGVASRRDSVRSRSSEVEVNGSTRLQLDLSTG